MDTNSPGLSQNRPRFHPPLAMAAIAVVLIGSLAACGDDEPESATPTREETTAAEDPADVAAQYCASVEEIEAFAEEVFTRSETELAAQGKEPTLEDELDAEREVLAFIKAQGYDQMDLPPEMEDDYRVFFEDFETKLAADSPQEPTAEAQAAEERLLEWEEANCAQ